MRRRSFAEGGTRDARRHRPQHPAFLDDVPLSKLGAADLDRLHHRLRENGRPRRPPVGAEWGWLGVNPASSATPPRAYARHQPPGAARAGRLFALASEADSGLADYVLLAAATGARRSELVALRWAISPLPCHMNMIGRDGCAGAFGTKVGDGRGQH